MKKWITLLLCLLLAVPLTAYAEGTEGQNPPSSESQPSESKPAESQPNESKPPESKPAESQPTESQPSESQPSESKPAETKPTETQPSDHTHVWDVSYTVAATCHEEGAKAYGCSACGAVSVEILPKLEHKFSTQWTRKAKGHWHACTLCGEEADFGKHYPGPAATEEKAQICLTCGYTLTAKLSHTHKYETTYSSDEKGHWYACGGCEEQKDFGEHTFDNDCDADCNICGFRKNTAHSYSSTWNSDGEGHWDICTICREESTPEPHIPGPEATETEAQVCTACGFELVPALSPTEHIHMGESLWHMDTENHWKLCACGETADKEPHHWDSGEEQEDAVILYTCKNCGAVRMEEKVKTQGISTLVWLGLAITALLGTAAGILLLLIPRLRKGGKYGK